MRTMKRALRGTNARVIFLTDRRMALARGLSRWLNSVGLGHFFAFRLGKLQVIYDLLRGRSSHACLEGAGWRVRPHANQSTSPDPIAQGAGLLWISPVLPTTREHVARVATIARPIFERHGFEYQVTLTSVNPRALCAVMTICYDKTNPAEVRRARECHDEVFDALMSAGYTPYRAGNLSMARVADRSEVFWDVVAALKAALDPAGIIAPGHYEPKR
jgi:4-cresol dehydrogenase (hydroxylating)